MKITKRFINRGVEEYLCRGNIEPGLYTFQFAPDELGARVFTRLISASKQTQRFSLKDPHM